MCIPSRTITIKGKWRLNPNFADRPECEFCYKKVTQVFSDNLLDDIKTPKKVCKHCKNELATMRKLLKEIN